jgi:hypothetical protein
MMMKQSVWCLLLCWIPTTTIGQVTSSTNQTGGDDLLEEDSSAIGARGNCICQGRGELRSEHALNWLGGLADLLEGIVPAEEEEPDGEGGSPRVYTCGEIQGFLSDRTECPEALWLADCCTEGPPFYQCSQQVRNKILNGYDKLSHPSKSLIHEVVTVMVQLEYHTVTSVSETQGTVEMFVHLTLQWKDPRLAWDYDPSPNGTCTVLPVTARAEVQQGLKDSEIWVPEFDLENRVSGVKSMKGPLATVYNDGSVTWLRSGNLKAICQMYDLGQIPFDSLGCQLIMGSSGLGVTYQLDPNGAITSSGYAGPYNGYRLKSATPGYDAKRNLIFFNFDYVRGKPFYVQNIIVPVTLFSYFSILTMVLGVGAFQTMALNFTLLLTSVTQKITTSRLLPVTNEKLWLVDYVSGSFYFIVFTIVESLFKFIILYMREERQKEEAGREEADDERPQEDTQESKRLPLPPIFYTFSLRKMDVICCWVLISFYTLFIVVSFAAQNRWGTGLQFQMVTNQTGSEL